MQDHFVKVAPDASVRLHQDVRCLVGNIDLSFDARGLLQQSLLVHGACVRIDRRDLRLGMERRRKGNDRADRKHAEDETHPYP